MLPISFKISNRLDVVGPLQKFLVSRYGERTAEQHAPSLAALQELRNDVVSVTQPSAGAEDILARYHAQLVAVADKLPIYENGVRLSFSWSDSLHPKRISTLASWKYEMACVLYNLAACIWQQATITPRNSPEAIEAVAKQFCRAVGVLVTVRDTLADQLVGDIPSDLRRDGLVMQIQMGLAQSQACYYERARLSKLKPELIAMLAGQAADLYRSARAALSEEAWAEVERDREFPTALHLSFMSMCFDAASFNQFSKKVAAEVTAHPLDGYGKEIAWLTVASRACAAAQNAVRGSQNRLAGKIDLSSVQNLQAEIAARKAEAEQENRDIYRNPVPSPGDLPHIRRADLAKPTPMADTAAALRTDLFSELVPVEVAGALTLLDEKLQALVAEAQQRGATASEDARRFLAERGLPLCLQEPAPGAPSASASQLPDTLWEHVRRVQIEGGLRELDRLAADAAHGAAAVGALLGSGEGALDTEAASDAACRATHGEREWTAARSDVAAAELRGELAKLRDGAERAAAIDARVADKLGEARGRLAGLSRTRGELEVGLPRPAPQEGGAGPPPGAGPSAAEDKELASLRAGLRVGVAELQGLLEARGAAAAAIRDRIDRRAAIRELQGAASVADYPALVDRIVGGAAATRAGFEANLGSQARVLDTLTAQWTRYGELRMQDSRTRAREAAIGALGADVDRFEELLSNLREGTGFYKQLTARAEALLLTCKDFAAAREMQQRDLLLSLRGARQQQQPQAQPQVAQQLQQQQALPDSQMAATAAAMEGLRLARDNSIGGGMGGAAPAPAAPFSTPYPSAPAPFSTPFGASAYSATPLPAPGPGGNPFSAPQNGAPGVLARSSSFTDTTVELPVHPNPFQASPYAGAAPQGVAASPYAAPLQQQPQQQLSPSPQQLWQQHQQQLPLQQQPQAPLNPAAWQNQQQQPRQGAYGTPQQQPAYAPYSAYPPAQPFASAGPTPPLQGGGGPYAGAYPYSAPTPQAPAAAPQGYAPSMAPQGYAPSAAPQSWSSNGPAPSAASSGISSSSGGSMEWLEALTAMGYRREAAQAALIRANGDLNGAIELLK